MKCVKRNDTRRHIGNVCRVCCSVASGVLFLLLLCVFVYGNECFVVISPYQKAQVPDYGCNQVRVPSGRDRGTLVGTY